MNLALALAAAFAFVAAGRPFGAVGLFLQLFFAINVFLAVFNLLPLPPLDGSRLLTIFLPRDKQRIIFFLDQYGFLILLVLVFFGGLQLLEPLVVWVRDVLLAIAGA
jgi:Zn-dependent protease